MTIEPGALLPEATLRESTEFGEACPLAPADLQAAEAARGKRIVIVGVPGAFTPTCSVQHIPSYLANYDALKAKGVDEIWCVAVNDGFVMAAWGREQKALGKIRFLGDGSAEFAQKLGLERDLSASGMGIRMKRCSLLVENGIVRRVNVESPGKFEVSDAVTMLGQLD
jgi:glutaredoxin/glutathione-dependent peroxiredoxin